MLEKTIDDFFGKDFQVIRPPSFRTLLGLERSDKQLSIVRRELAGIEAICTNHDMHVQIAELAIIQDERLTQEQDPRPRFVTTTLFCPESLEGHTEAVRDAFVSALKCTYAGEGAGNTISRLDLYRFLYKYWDMPSPTTTQNRREAVPIPWHAVLLHEGYHYSLTEDGKKIDEAVDDFLIKFQHELGDLSSLFHRSVVLAVPFCREPWDEATDQPLFRHDAPPGGALFLYVQPRSLAGIRWGDFASALHLLLARAALGEALGHVSMTQKRVAASLGVEAIAHHIKNLIMATGWEGARRGLMQKPLAEDAVADAIRSLSLFMLAEGTSGLLRLISLTLQGDHGKLRAWTSETQVSKWDLHDPTVFPRYAEYVKKLVAAICYGLRKDVKRFWWCENAQSRTELGTTDPPVGSLEDWTCDIGALAPFSLPGRRPDSHIALMAPLLEPVFNALKSLKDGQALSVHIVDRIPNAVEIHVANDSDDPPLQLAPGLKQAQDLWSKTKLATIDLLPKGECCCTGVFGDRAYTCVRVKLHPDILAKQILDHSRGSGEQT